MREPHDVFVREFLQHPAWSEVFDKLNSLANALVNEVFVGTIKEFEIRKGKAEGVYEAMALLRGLIQNANKG